MLSALETRHTKALYKRAFFLLFYFENSIVGVIICRSGVSQVGRFYTFRLTGDFNNIC